MKVNAVSGNFMRIFFRQSKKVKMVAGISIDTPKPRHNLEDIAICAFMRNEERNIEDWLRYHGVCGIRNFFLYNNRSTDNCAQIAQSIDGLNVKVIPWHLTICIKDRFHINQQVVGYCHAISTFGERFRWMAFLDIDEFIVPKKNLAVIDALNLLSEYSNVSLPWTMFGTNGHVMPPSEPAVFSYLTRAAKSTGELLRFKCIVEPSKVTHVGIHAFSTTNMGDNSVNDVGYRATCDQKTSEDFLSTENIQLNHYYTKSESELIEKIEQKPLGVLQQTPNQRKQIILRKVAMINANLIEDDSAIQFLRRHGINNKQDLYAKSFY